MDNNTSSPQGPAPGPHPGVPHRPVQPMGRRPMVDGFAPRRPLQSAPGMTPARPLQPHPAGHPDITPAPHAQPQPLARPQQPGVPGPMAAPQPRPAGPPAGHQPPRPEFPAHPRPDVSPGAPASRQPEPPVSEAPTSASRPGREKNRTGHAGLVGFVVFILLGALLLSPLLPGKIMDSLPFASSSFSTGDQSLDCIGAQGKMSSATRYDTKAGAPVTYTYSTSTTQTATCNGQTQHATVGHTSQFNPLGLVIDILVALVAAIIVARVWRLIFGAKKHTPHRRED